MEYKYFFIIIFFLFLSFLILFVPSFRALNLNKGTFLVYNETSYIYNGEKTEINEIILIQKVLCNFNNGSILLNFTIIAVNETSYFSPSISIQNASHPQGMFYICPSLLGKNITCNGETILVYNGTKNGLYTYYHCSYFLGAKNIFILYFNSSGIALYGIDKQCQDGLIQSITYYKLWRTNLINNESLPTFPGYTLAHTLTYNFSSAVQKQQKFHEIILAIFLIGILGIIGVLLFRKVD